MSSTVNNSVRQYRLRAEITQEELAEQVEVTRQTIIALEKGSYEPSVALALRLARYFKHPLEKLFYLSEKGN